MPSSKAAASEDRRRSISHPPTPSCQDSLFSAWGYVEDLNDARTKFGKRCDLAHQGWAGEKGDFFSVP